MNDSLKQLTRSMRSSRNCIWTLINIFDFHQPNPSATLLSNGNGVSANTNPGTQLSFKTLTKGKSRHVDIFDNNLSEKASYCLNQTSEKKEFCPLKEAVNLEIHTQLHEIFMHLLLDNAVLQERPNEATESLPNQISSNPKEFTLKGFENQPKEFMDAIKLLCSDKVLFLSILRDSNLLMMKNTPESKDLGLSIADLSEPCNVSELFEETVSQTLCQAKPRLKKLAYLLRREEHKGIELEYGSKNSNTSNSRLMRVQKVRSFLSLRDIKRKLKVIIEKRGKDVNRRASLKESTEVGRKISCSSGKTEWKENPSPECRENLPPIEKNLYSLKKESAIYREAKKHIIATLNELTDDEILRAAPDSKALLEKFLTLSTTCFSSIQNAREDKDQNLNEIKDARSLPYIEKITNIHDERDDREQGSTATESGTSIIMADADIKPGCHEPHNATISRRSVANDSADNEIAKYYAQVTWLDAFPIYPWSTVYPMKPYPPSPLLNRLCIFLSAPPSSALDKNVII